MVEIGDIVWYRGHKCLVVDKSGAGSALIDLTAMKEVKGENQDGFVSNFELVHWNGRRVEHYPGNVDPDANYAGLGKIRNYLG